jgi:WD40 repeat protein
MVTASFDKTIKLWNAHTMEIKHTFRGHQEEVHCVKFNSKGDKLVSGGSDNLVKVWCLNSLK